MLKPNFFFILSLMFITIAVVALLYGQRTKDAHFFKANVGMSWQNYKNKFLFDGMVLRDGSNDVVSEGQAYVMLRAVVINDRSVFDECFEWTERNLSRKESFGDNLLAWNYKNGQVVDWLTASDADLDYAFALLLAFLRWNDNRYLQKAKTVMEDIIKHETYRNDSGRLYLLPWHNNNGAKVAGRIIQNLSYYSPAYFRLFYVVTADKKWLELLETNYYLLNSFLKDTSIHLVPDWCSVDYNDHVGPAQGKSSLFSWDALRVPLRLALDDFLFEDDRTYMAMKHFNDFFVDKIMSVEKINAGYDLKGVVKLDYESPVMYVVSHVLANIFDVDSSIVTIIDRRLRIKRTEDYYSSSLVWIIDWLNENKDGKDDIKEKIIKFIG